MNINFGNTEHISSNKGTTSGEVTQQHYIPALTRRPTKSGSEGSIKSWQSMVNSHPRSPEGFQEDKQAIEPGMKYKWVGNNTAQGGYWKKWWPSTTGKGNEVERTARNLQGTNNSSSLLTTSL
jgi:hypothetical protein